MPASAAMNALSMRFSLSQRIQIPHRYAKRLSPDVDFVRQGSIADKGDTQPAEAKFGTHRPRHQPPRQRLLRSAAGGDRPLVEPLLDKGRIAGERADPRVQTLPGLGIDR